MFYRSCGRADVIVTPPPTKPTKAALLILPRRNRYHGSSFSLIPIIAFPVHACPNLQPPPNQNLNYPLYTDCLGSVSLVGIVEWRKNLHNFQVAPFPKWKRDKISLNIRLTIPRGQQSWYHNNNTWAIVFVPIHICWNWQRMTNYRRTITMCPPESVFLRVIRAFLCEIKWWRLIGLL